MGNRSNNKKRSSVSAIIIGIIIVLGIAFGVIKPNDANVENTANTEKQNSNTNITTSTTQTVQEANLSTIPEYTSSPYVTINNNVPNFTEADYTTKAFEKYSELDNLGRCGVAYANICTETMPPEGDKRGSISSVKPTGWVQKKYNGEYLYNRCHLIGYQLSDEDANEKNLITGTRYFNVEGMLPFENKVAEYIDNHKNNHVLYRVTPIYNGNNLLASGVQMEAKSVEDKGEGLSFNVYCYNVQPGIKIDYATGESSDY